MFHSPVRTWDIEFLFRITPNLNETFRTIFISLLHMVQNFVPKMSIPTNRTSPDAIAPTAPPPQPPQSLAARNGEFSNAWNSFLLTPTKDTEQQQQQQNLFPSAHGDFSPPTFPPSTFTTTTPPPPATITAPKSLPECKSSSFDQGLLKKTIAKPKSQELCGRLLCSRFKKYLGF